MMMSFRQLAEECMSLGGALDHCPHLQKLVIAELVLLQARAQGRDAMGLMREYLGHLPVGVEASEAAEAVAEGPVAGWLEEGVTWLREIEGRATAEEFEQVLEGLGVEIAHRLEVGLWD